MIDARPHYYLYSEASRAQRGASRWKFLLELAGSDECFSASDLEPETRRSRLELLAVVRGLEALDQPSRVTLVTRSRYVARGVRRDLGPWRERNWRWERFGQLVPIRDHDLWQRVDRALQFHQLECIAWHGEIQGAMRTAWRGHAVTQEHGHSKPWPWHPAASPWSLSRTLHALRGGILAPFSAILRPAFTRAA